MGFKEGGLGASGRCCAAVCGVSVVFSSLYFSINVFSDERFD
jgi:hypothetical protein